MNLDFYFALPRGPAEFINDSGHLQNGFITTKNNSPGYNHGLKMASPIFAPELEYVFTSYQLLN